MLLDLQGHDGLSTIRRAGAFLSRSLNLVMLAYVHGDGLGGLYDLLSHLRQQILGGPAGFRSSRCRHWWVP